MPGLEKINPGDFPPTTQIPKIYETPELPESERKYLTLRALGVVDIEHTFTNIKKPQGFDKTYQAFREILKLDGRFVLFVYGGDGNGKTYSCEASVIELYNKGIRCGRRRWSDIVRHLKELMKRGGYENYFNALRSSRYLILDDVGSGSTLGDWEWGELEDIIDYRLEQRLFTIITTNLDGTDIPKRILSRLKDKSKAILVYNEAKDQRPLQELK